jgi:hypothetical protein
MSTVSQITQIGKALQDAEPYERVVVTEGRAFKVAHGYEFYQRIPDMLYWTFPRDYRRENQNTIDYFYKVFGERKIEILSEKYNLEISYKRQWGLPITKGDVEKIFAGMASVYYEDLEIFFDEVKRNHGKEGYRHLSSEDVYALQELFGDRHFSHLNNEELKILYHKMIPFEDVETIFLGKPPEEVFCNSHKPEENFEDFQKFLYTYEILRRRGLKELTEESSSEVRNKYHLFHMIRMVKKLMNFHLPKGLVFDTPKGLIYFHSRFEAGGAFCLAMKAVKPDPEKKFLSRLYFLPTQCLNRVKRPWESLVDDLRDAIGAQGAMAIYPKVEDVLRETRGFVGEKEQIDIYGYSLGGNQGARVACALYPTGRIRKLFSTSNPGIDEDTANYFNQLVDLHRFPMKISYAFEWDDHTWRYGKAQLGQKADPKIIKTRVRVFESKGVEEKGYRRVEYEPKELREFPKRRICALSGPAMAGLLIRSLNDAHPRESYLCPNLIEHTVTNYPESEKGDEYLIRQRFLDRYLLTNEELGWEERREEIIKAFHRRTEGFVERHDEKTFVDFLRDLHARRA